MARRIGIAEVDDTTSDGKRRAQEWVAAAAQPDDLVLDAILLRGESERCRRGGQQLRVGAEPEVEACRSQEQLNVGEGEGGCLGRGVGVLARPEKKEKRDDNHVGDSAQNVRVRWQARCDDGYAADDLHRDGLHSVCWWVRLLPARKHSRDSEVGFPSGVQPWIVGPHRQERLRNSP